MFKNFFVPDNRSAFRFCIGRLHVTKHVRYHSMTGFRKLAGPFFWKIKLSKQFLAGFEQCRQAILSEIELTQDSTARVKPKSWDGGFETALNFIKRKTTDLKPQ